MPSEEIYKKVVKLVSLDRTEDAIKLLQSSLEEDPKRDPNSYHSVILLISQYNNWENKRRNNLRSDVGELNRINGEILSIASDLAKPEDQLRIPENYVPPVPSTAPIGEVQQPMVQKTVNIPAASAKKENWVTPARILSVIGGLFLVILVLTLIFPSDDESPNSNTSNIVSPPPAATPTYIYNIPTEYPHYGTDINQANFNTPEAAVQFVINELRNSQWVSINESAGDFELKCDASAANCDLLYTPNGAQSKFRLLGFADDGYVYLELAAGDNINYFAAEFIEDRTVLRLYELNPNLSPDQYTTLDLLKS